ncbi:cobalamin biosynthesis protein [Entomobacter blattae]|uniref:CobE/GbiG C-terminal domain-containing protein n=1 Tax=Entomobacter blattae TaxID=2762277 RepID=A0A7H1NQ21_9PROT|nr:cobalamin biosynthesis protein [Entomobacter blattae]QNT77881.1 hypothetical protein JGUZn3_06390 [Entomobacter blattae]
MADPPYTVAGFGCRPYSPLTDLTAAFRQLSHVSPFPITAVAAPYFRQELALFSELSHMVSLPLYWISLHTLKKAQPYCQSYSQQALNRFGIAAIAEGCAIARCLAYVTEHQGAFVSSSVSAICTMPKLVFPKMSFNTVTIALASINPPKWRPT